MNQKNDVWLLLNELSFTNKEVASFVGVTEAMIKKIRNGSSLGSSKVQNRIKEFLKRKANWINEKIKSSSLFSHDDV